MRRLPATSASWATSLACIRAELTFSTGLFTRSSKRNALSASCACGPITSDALCVSDPRLERGERVRMIVNITGVTMPVPTPWTRRPANNTGYVGASAATVAPATIAAAAVTNRERGAKRRCSQPVIGRGCVGVFGTRTHHGTVATMGRPS